MGRSWVAGADHGMSGDSGGRSGGWEDLDFSGSGPRCGRLAPGNRVEASENGACEEEFSPTPHHFQPAGVVRERVLPALAPGCPPFLHRHWRGRRSFQQAINNGAAYSLWISWGFWGFNKIPKNIYLAMNFALALVGAGGKTSHIRQWSSTLSGNESQGNPPRVVSSAVPHRRARCQRR